jgi:hypothetical protein
MVAAAAAVVAELGITYVHLTDGARGADESEVLCEFKFAVRERQRAADVSERYNYGIGNRPRLLLLHTTVEGL